MQRADGAWVGWSGSAGEAPDPFDTRGVHLVGVPLSAEEIEAFYEGFSNVALWPLYHDVIAAPQFHRRWWDAYVEVNDRFAALAAALAAPARACGCTTTSCSWCPPCCDSGGRSCGSGSSTTFPSPATRSTRSC